VFQNPSVKSPFKILKEANERARNQVMATPLGFLRMLNSRKRARR